MIKQSKVAIVRSYGSADVLEFDIVDVPSPNHDEIQIRQKAVGLNFIDIYCRTGLYKRPLPHGLGFEAAGVVEQIGKDVTHVKVGDRVAYAQSPIGAYAELRNIPGRQVVSIPDAVSFEDAAALMLKGLTVQYLFRQTYRLQGGETILFQAAAGGVGLIACQWARALGVRLIGTASSQAKAEAAIENGAAEVINYSDEDIVERVMALTDGKKVPVVYDGVGAATWEASLDCLQPRGLMVNFGSSSGPVTGIEARVLGDKGSLYFTRPVIGTYLRTHEALSVAAGELFDLVAQKKISSGIKRRYSFTEIAQAHRDLEERKTIGASVILLD